MTYLYVPGPDVWVLLYKVGNFSAHSRKSQTYIVSWKCFPKLFSFAIIITENIISYGGKQKMRMLDGFSVPRPRGRYNQYDTSIKKYIAAGGNPALAWDLGIPNSTVSSWRRTDFSKYITHSLSGSSYEDELRLFQKFLKDRFAQRLFKAYLSISEIFHHLLRLQPDFKDVLNNSKNLILQTIRSTKNIIGINNVLKLFRISRSKYDMWVKNISCTASFVGLCVKNFPNQLSKREVDRLKSFLSDFSHRNWPLISVYYEAVRKNLIAFSLSTFYKYAQILGFSAHIADSRRKNHVIGLRASDPNQFWHADVTIFKPMDNTRVYIYLVVDNFSRYILAWRASLTLSASTMWENLLEAYRNAFSGRADSGVSLIVDGGPENKPIPFDPHIPINKLVAQQDILFSNSMVEAVNKQVKYRYLFTRDLIDFKAVVGHLKVSIPEFNNIRPYGPLFGLTPAEAFSGIRPDKKRFSGLFEQAREQRYLINTTKPCPLCDD